MKQDIRSGSLDLITPGELGEQLHAHLGTAFSRQLRETYRGLKIIRLPAIVMNATTAAFTLYNNPPSANCGPESGYIWEIKRVTIESSLGATDTAVITGLYVGSDSAPNQRMLIDRVNQKLGQAFIPSGKSVWAFADEQVFATITGATPGTTYTLTGIALEVPTEMQGKLVLGG